METTKAEIPEDVMEAAFALQTARMVGVSFMSRAAADAIAAAILADRQRRVSKTVVKFEPQIVGSSYRFDPDQILEEAKGQGFTNILIIGELESGELWVSSAANAGEAMILMEKAKRRICFGED